jgi:predicted esterase YcpF (UPF0227 family)
MFGMTFATHVLYLHGFRSGPQSTKARFVGAWFAEHHPEVVWCCPQLPASPKDSAKLILTLVQDWPRHSMVVMGSSLGGFYATWVAAHLGCAAVLLNPAVHPARDLVNFIGEQPTWHKPEDSIYFDPAFIEELKALYVGAGLAWLGLPSAVADAKRLLTVIATGDEVLDWHEMAARYAHAQQHIIQGSDHGLSDFEDVWPVVLDFLT